MYEYCYSFNQFLKKKFPGERVVKIPINAGFSCPNRDGTLSAAGCIYCDRYAAGPPRMDGWPIGEQIDDYIRRHPGKKYIAYYQSHCNTYGQVPELEAKYEIVFQYQSVVGLFIGTRPDAVPLPVLSVLERINRRTYLCVELGLQSIHEGSLSFLNRNHTYEQFLRAFAELRARGIAIVVHLIVGIPGESRRHMLETIEAMNGLRPEGVKFHLLHVLSGTELHSLYARSAFPLLGQEEYAGLMADLLEHLDPGIVVHRLTAEREKEMFIAPLWALNKPAVLDSIRSEMRKRNSFQGRYFRAC
jgi:radical SAM protein (TIGR01212 family)